MTLLNVITKAISDRKMELGKNSESTVLHKIIYRHKKEQKIINKTHNCCTNNFFAPLRI